MVISPVPTMNEALPIPRLVEIGEIEASPFQPRSHYDEGALNELAADIATKGGVLQPVWVRPVRGKTPIKFQLIFGHRRWIASQRAGFAKIPAVVRDVDDNESRRLALVENIDSEPLSDYDEARAVLDLWTAYEHDAGQKLSQNEICRRMNRSGQWLINKRKIATISDDLKPIAKAHFGVMTQLFEIDETKDALRETLKAMFDTKGKKRASVIQVRETIAAHQAKTGARRAAQTAPDAQSRRAGPNGTAPESRGMALRVSSRAEATENAQQAAVAAIGNLETCRQWMDHAATLPKAELQKIKRLAENLLRWHTGDRGADS